MGHFKGLDMLWKIDVGGGSFTTVGGQTSTGITIGNEMIDTTDKGSNEWRDLLDGAGQKSVSISASGVLDDAAPIDTIRAALLAGTILDQQLVEGTGTWEGAFKITSFEITGETNDKQTYSVSLESSGAITFT